MSITVDSSLKELLWYQFGAAIESMENAIAACPDNLWGRRARSSAFWYLAYHTLFWLDFYMSDSPEHFAPPPPFGMEEMDPAGVLPPTIYSKAELQAYLHYGREKCRAKINGLTDETANARFRSGWMDFSTVELMLYTTRHVQHHAAQMNILLRQHINSAPRWVSRAKIPLA